ncbi:ZIP family metal transporter [Candidatus Formimonas warabiya]|uniref:ZIP family metal transporter n=2 Tax=Formimonas warabiya TaxID=1761012 RepID=A0A3G1KU54_FORW1|nr:ZIP family metal transporter [Candidatus Formimonas warabiya]
MQTILLYSVVAGLATCLGGLLVVVIQKPGEKFLALTLGCAAGIMFGVAILDLIPSAWVYGTPAKFFSGFGAGVLLLKILDLILSKITLGVPRARDRIYLLNMGYLVAIGIALHDLPEGMAIAVGYEAAGQLGLLIALAIGLHNIPEGMAISAPLKMAGMRGGTILLITGLTSIFTPLGTCIGLMLVSFSRYFISFLLAAAAGAMLYIVFGEIGPESRRRHPNYAKLGIAAGIMVILLISLIH